MNGQLSDGQRASAIGLALNGGLALVKLATGIVGQSYALVADAIESLGDVVSSMIVWSGLSIACKPADENHPYGHGKADPLAALAVAVMLVGVAGLIAIQATHEIGAPHAPPARYTLVVLVAVIVVKEYMYRYEWRVGQRTGSTAVSIDAWHHRSDAITSAAAGIGITIAIIGGDTYAAADDWAALAACAVIAFNAVRFGRSAIAELMDTLPQTSLADSILREATEVDGARFVERMLVRKMGPKLYVDMHLEVDPALTVLEAHRIGHEVKDAIIGRYPEVADVLVHLEPHDTENGAG